MIVMFAIVLTVVVTFVGLVVDGGYALTQRRGSQNAADFAALAGARVVAEKIGGDGTNGTDANVQAAIASVVAANGGRPITFSAPDGPRYIASDGSLLGYVGTGAIPAEAVGVHVVSDRVWRPLLPCIIRAVDWTARAGATA